MPDGSFFNETLLSLAGVFTMIGTAFVAARKSAEQANKTAQETLTQVVLMRETMKIKDESNEARYSRMEREIISLSQKLDSLKHEVDLMRGALGTRREDDHDDTATF